jgi:hypothetical protein
MEASEESLPYYKLEQELDVPFSEKRLSCIECVESRHKYRISIEAAGAYAASSALIINKLNSLP